MTDVKVMTGVVVWFDSKKGIGFIKPDDGGKDLFLHFTNIQMDGFKTVKPLQRVSYEIGSNHRGPQSINVKILSEAENE